MEIYKIINSKSYYKQVYSIAHNMNIKFSERIKYILPMIRARLKLMKMYIQLYAEYNSNTNFTTKNDSKISYIINQIRKKKLRLVLLK